MSRLSRRTVLVAAGVGAVVVAGGVVLFPIPEPPPPPPAPPPPPPAPAMAPEDRETALALARLLLPAAATPAATEVAVDAGLRANGADPAVRAFLAWVRDWLASHPADPAADPAERTKKLVGGALREHKETFLDRVEYPILRAYYFSPEGWRIVFGHPHGPGRCHGLADYTVTPG